MAFFLSMVHHFAMNTVFTVSGEVVFGLIVVLAVVLAVVAVAPVVLSARTIAAPVVVLLLRLLPLLRFKSSYILFLGGQGFQISPSPRGRWKASCPSPSYGL